MPDTALSAQITDWFMSTIAGSPLWAGLGLAAAGLLAIWLIWQLVRGLAGFLGLIRNKLASHRRRQTQGYTLGIAPLSGARGNAISKALTTALQAHISDFSFGAPVDVIQAPAPSTTKTLGQREVARKWLGKSASDLVAWGYRTSGKNAPYQLNILSCEGSLTPAEAKESQALLPADFHKSSDIVKKVGAYLIARALQPGLAVATAFKAEKLVPVADFLADAIAAPGSLPPQTQLLIETDYCAMGLHIGDDVHLERVVSLRRARLSADTQLNEQTRIEARIDLGRALLAISGKRFDPTRVREAMDHLKIAVDMLREHPTIRLASQTSAAVQQGQSMLQNRQRFSVTGGSSI